MEENVLKDYSKIELLRFINDTKKNHEEKKQEIYNIIDEIEKFDKHLNAKLAELDSIETRYVRLMEEYNERD